MTRLGEGTEVAKTHPRVEGMGVVDEVNAAMGQLVCEAPSAWQAELERIQHDLFDLGGELCLPGHTLVQAERVAWLEERLDAMNTSLPDLEEFILPGGCRAAAQAHVARTICRRAERVLLAVEDGSAVGLSYVNRLSDYLFVLARSLNQAAGMPDVLWKNPRRAGDDQAPRK